MMMIDTLPRLYFFSQVDVFCYFGLEKQHYISLEYFFEISIGKNCNKSFAFCIAGNKFNINSKGLHKTLLKGSVQNLRP